MVRDRINAGLRRIPVWLVYLCYAIPAPALFYMGATGGLGVEPIKALEQELGEIALQLLVIVLVITPLRRFTGLNFLRFRRAFGLLAFFYVCIHFAVYIVLDVQALTHVWADIVKRPYITVGFTAFVLMLPLAVTSNNWSVRRLGPRWRRLHRLTYAIAVLGAVHFLWLVKGVQPRPLVYLAIILALLAVRLVPTRRRRTA